MKKKYLLFFAIFLILTLAGANFIHILTYKPTQPISTVKQTQTGLTILTYNIGHFRRGGGNYSKIFQNLIQIIRDNNIDIIALQEIIGPNSTYQSVEDMAEVLDYFYYTNEKPLENNWGVAILSKWPLLNTTTYNLPVTLSRPRSLISAIVNTSQGMVPVISLHLQTPRLLGQRYHQVKQIIQIASEFDRIIIMGDFNTPPSRTDRTYQKMAANYLDLWLSTGLNSQKGRTWPAIKPIIRVDYIWITDNIDIVEKSVKLLRFANVTDHVGIMATIDVSI